VLAHACLMCSCSLYPGHKHTHIHTHSNSTFDPLNARPPVETTCRLPSSSTSASSGREGLHVTCMMWADAGTLPNHSRHQEPLGSHMACRFLLLTHKLSHVRHCESPGKSHGVPICTPAAFLTAHQHTAQPLQAPRAPGGSHHVSFCMYYTQAQLC